MVPKTPSNKRKHDRVSVSVPATVSPKSDPKKVYEAEVLDISEGGAFVHCIAPLAIGEAVVIEIRFGESRLLEGEVISANPFKKGKETISEASVVRWARGSNNSGFGIEFQGMNVERTKFLTKVVAYFQQLEKAGVTLKK